jgi:hypothetical protein
VLFRHVRHVTVSRHNQEHPVVFPQLSHFTPHVPFVLVFRFPTRHPLAPSRDLLCPDRGRTCRGRTLPVAAAGWTTFADPTRQLA